MVRKPRKVMQSGPMPGAHRGADPRKECSRSGCSAQRAPKDQAPGELAVYQGDGVLKGTAVRLISFDEDSAQWKCLHETGETIHAFPENLAVLPKRYENTNNFLCRLVKNGYEAAKLELWKAALAGNVPAMRSYAMLLEGEDQAMWLRKAVGRGCERSMVRLATLHGFSRFKELMITWSASQDPTAQPVELVALASDWGELLEKFLKSVRSGKRPWPIEKEVEQAWVVRAKCSLLTLLRSGVLPDGIARSNRLNYLMQGAEAAHARIPQPDCFEQPGMSELSSTDHPFRAEAYSGAKAQMQAEQELERNASELLRSSKDACRKLENEKLKALHISRLEHAADVEELESAIEAASGLDVPELDTARARLVNLQQSATGPQRRLREAAKNNLLVQLPVSEGPLPLQLPTAEVEEEQPSSMSRRQKQKLCRNQIALKKRAAAAEVEAVKAADERKRLLRAHPSIWEPQSAAVEADGVVAEQILLVESDTVVRATVLESEEESSAAMPKSSAPRRPVNRRAQQQLRLGLDEFINVFNFTGQAPVQTVLSPQEPRMLEFQG